MIMQNILEISDNLNQTIYILLYFKRHLKCRIYLHRNQSNLLLILLINIKLFIIPDFDHTGLIINIICV